MSKLLPALIAAGFVFGLGTANAQDVKSDDAKAQGQEEVMKQKEQGKDQAVQGQRNRPTSDDGRSAQGAGTSSDNTSGAKDQEAPKTQSGSQIPEQSAPAVGHPEEGKPTGQGRGVQKQNEQSGQSDSSSGASTSNQDGTSGQAGNAAGTDPSQGGDKRKQNRPTQQ